MDPVILGALIALAGAALGTLIQVHIVHRQRTWTRVETIRNLVHKLGANCLAYSTTMYQRGHDANEYKGWEGAEEHIKNLGLHLNETYHKSMEGCFELMACGEPRVADGASSLHHGLINLHNTWIPRFANQEKFDLVALDKERKAAIEDVNILMNMVEPRLWERIWLFRRPSTAKKMLAKLRAEKTKNGD